MSDLITVKEACVLLGFATPQLMHALAKKAEIPKYKEGGRTFFDKEELLAKATAFRESKPVRVRKKTGSVSATTEKIRIKDQVPFAENPKFIAWNKGKWRGWCFAAVEDVDDDIIKIITDYNNKAMWIPEAVAADISQGKAFVMEPAQVLRFMVLQLTHVKETGFEDLIPKLDELAKEFDAIEQEYKETQR